MENATRRVCVTLPISLLDRLDSEVFKQKRAGLRTSSRSSIIMQALINYLVMAEPFTAEDIQNAEEVEW